MDILIKTYTLIVLLIALSSSPALCSHKPDEVIIAHSKTLAPYAFVNSKDQSTGMLIDLWNVFGQLNNVKVKFRPTSWSQSIALVKSKDADLHSGLFYSRERSKYLDFSDTLKIQVTTRLFISHKLKASSIPELDSVKIGVVKDDFTETYLKQQHPNINTQRFVTTWEMVKAGIRGDVLAFLSDYATAMYFLHRENSPNSFSVHQMIYRKNLYSATAKGNTELLNFINEGLKNIPEDELERITNKWIQPEAKIPHWVPYAIGVGFVTILTCFLIIYIYTLQKNKIRLRIIVDKRTRELRQRNKELRQKNKELESALKEVKVLSGILPICSSCKKIRNNQGYWNQVEEYITTHSEAQFTHGICEDCARELYKNDKWYKLFIEKTSK